MRTELNTISKCTEALNRYHHTATAHHRFLSWEHCYKAFFKAREKDVWDDDKLCLHLAFYLASWGMYRGSSFLLQKDYLIHQNAIEVIKKKKYDDLQGIRCEDLMLKKDIFISLYEELVNAYSEFHRDKAISITLITKVILGTLGCIPAFDRFFVSGIEGMEISDRIKNYGQFNDGAIDDLCDFYHENSSEFDGWKRDKIKDTDIDYPQMKLLDMAFWQLGYDKYEKAKKSKEKDISNFVVEE